MKTSPKERRKILIEDMSRKEEQGLDCFSCSGVCCTYQNNSMQITPLEALEILDYLERENRLNENLIQRLKDNISEFRLDKDLLLGKKGDLRRYYTCPFFESPPKGCSISRSVKPYGCLAFNARRPNQTKGGECASDRDLLSNRDQEFKDFESEQNSIIKATYKLWWDKLPISRALLELYNCKVD